jgi:hypothetical protein
MNILSETTAPPRTQLPKELLRDARADYRMCITSGLVEPSSSEWHDFLAGYADNEAFYVARATAVCR